MWPRPPRASGPESLILTFGEDFDLIGNVAEVASTLYSAVCGARKPNVYFLGGLPVVAASLEALAAEGGVARLQGPVIRSSPTRGLKTEGYPSYLPRLN